MHPRGPRSHPCLCVVAPSCLPSPGPLQEDVVREVLAELAANDADFAKSELATSLGMGMVGSVGAGEGGERESDGARGAVEEPSQGGEIGACGRAKLRGPKAWLMRRLYHSPS